ncbi:MAG: peptidylprolyl isomerase [Campylobacter sp.]|nr:peptidylprolyl isomerase [Campylobacter sp.]
MVKKHIFTFLLCVSAVFGIEVTLKTNYGNITVNLFEDIAPKASENFASHSKNNYYDNVIFHRVIKGFMIQGGDPTGTGMGGESIWGENFKDEYRDKVFNKAGILAMANAGPNTNGSQFFITLGSTSWLNGYHTIFGEVVEGMDVVRKIGEVQTDRNDRPLEEVKILSTEVRE